MKSESIIKMELIQANNEIARLYVTTINDTLLENSYSILNVFSAPMIYQKHYCDKSFYIFGNIINNMHNIDNFIINDGNMVQNIWQNPITGMIEAPTPKVYNISISDIIYTTTETIYQLPQYITFKGIDNNSINVIDNITQFLTNTIIQYKIMNIHHLILLLQNINDNIYEIISYVGNTFNLKYISLYTPQINIDNFIDSICFVANSLRRNYTYDNLLSVCKSLETQILQLPIDVIHKIYNLWNIHDSNNNNSNNTNNYFYNNNIYTDSHSTYSVQDSFIAAPDKNSVDNIAKSLISEIRNYLYLYCQQPYGSNEIIIDVSQYTYSNNNLHKTYYVNDISVDIIQQHISELLMNTIEVITIHLNTIYNIFDTLNDKIIIKIQHNFILQETTITLKTIGDA